MPPAQAGNKNIHLIEVSYTNLASYQLRYNYKLKKYEAIIAELIALGWEPTLHIIILGTLGEIPRQLAVTLKDLGIKSTSLEKVQRDLHENAIHWMDTCIDTEHALNLKQQQL